MNLTLKMLAMALAMGLTLTACDKSETKSVKDLAPQTTDLGTGLNAVEKTYPRPAPVVFDVAMESLKSYGLVIDREVHDAFGGEIVAHRADGHPITTKVTSVDKDHSQVSIRVAPGNRNLAGLIHNRIEEKLLAAN